MAARGPAGVLYCIVYLWLCIYEQYLSHSRTHREIYREAEAHQYVMIGAPSAVFSLGKMECASPLSLPPSSGSPVSATVSFSSKRR